MTDKKYTELIEYINKNKNKFESLRNESKLNSKNHLVFNSELLYKTLDDVLSYLIDIVEPLLQNSNSEQHINNKLADINNLINANIERINTNFGNNLPANITELKLLALKIFGEIQDKILGFKTDNFKPNKIVGIITATQLEFNEVIKFLTNCNEFIDTDFDNSIYYIGQFVKENKVINVVLTRCHHMGMSAAATTCTKLIMKYHPSVIFMVGICAGNKHNSIKIGDILIAEKSLDYNQIIELDENKIELSSNFKQENLQESTIDIYNDEKLRLYEIDIESIIGTKADEFSNENELLEFIYMSYKKAKPEKPPTAKKGTFITGSSLLRSEEKFKQKLKKYHGIIGLDMETFGFYYSCRNSTYSYKPYFLSIKAVSDFGDNSIKKGLKPEERAEYAAYCSSNFLFNFVFSKLNFIDL